MSEATATQQGAAKPPRRGRDEMMAVLEQQRIEEVNAQLVEGGGEAIEDTGRGTEEDDQDQEDNAAEAERKRLAASPSEARKDDVFEFLEGDALTRTKAKIKIDGEEREVVVGDLLRDAQKFHAADKRLEDAALAKKRAEEEAAETIRKANEEAAEIRKRAGTAGDDKDESPSATDGMKQALDLLYEGDRDAGAVAFAKVVNDEVERRIKASGSGATVDPKAIAREVRSEVSWDAAYGQFSVNHKDIVGEIEADKRRKLVWVEALRDSEAKGFPTHAALLEDAAQEYRKSIPKTASGGKKVTTDDDDLDKRRERNRQAAAHSVRTDTGHRAGVEDTQEAEPTPSDTIAQMKEERRGKPK